MTFRLGTGKSLIVFYCLLLYMYTKPLKISLEEAKLLKYTSEPWYTIKIDQIFSFPFLQIEKESFPWRKINSFCEKNVARWTPHCSHPPSFYVSETESKEKIWCMGPYVGDDYNYNLPFPFMSTPESTPTHLPWKTLCQSRP